MRKVAFYNKIQKLTNFLYFIIKVRVFRKKRSYIGCVDHSDLSYGRHTQYKSENYKKRVFLIFALILGVSTIAKIAMVDTPDIRA